MGRFLHPMILRAAEIARPKRKSSAKDMVEADIPKKSVSAPISRLHELREQLHVPVDKFSKLLGIKTEIMRSLLCENHYNEAVVGKLLEKAETELKRKRKDKKMRYLLDTGMADIIDGWSKTLRLRGYSTQQALRIVSEITGKKYSTLYRWFRDDRKPLDIDELYEIDRMIRESKRR